MPHSALTYALYGLAQQYEYTAEFGEEEPIQTFADLQATVRNPLNSKRVMFEYTSDMFADVVGMDMTQIAPNLTEEKIENDLLARRIKRVTERYGMRDLYNTSGMGIYSNMQIQKGESGEYLRFIYDRPAHFREFDANLTITKSDGTVIHTQELDPYTFYFDLDPSVLGEPGEHINLVIELTSEEHGESSGAISTFLVPDWQKVEWHSDLTDVTDDHGTAFQTMKQTGTVVDRNDPSLTPTLQVQHEGRDSHATLTWNAIPGAHKYKIYVYSSENTSGAFLIADGDDTSIEVNGLIPGNTYYFAIRTIFVDESLTDEEKTDWGNWELNRDTPSGSSTHKTGRWNLHPIHVQHSNPSVKAAYEVQPGTNELAKAIDLIYEEDKDVQQKAVRYTSNTERISDHAVGRGIDIFYKVGMPGDEGRQEIARGYALYAFLDANRQSLGITQLIYRKFDGTPSDDLNKMDRAHADHIHVSVSRDASEDALDEAIALFEANKSTILDTTPYLDPNKWP